MTSIKKTKVIFLFFFLGLITLVFFLKSLDKSHYQLIKKDSSCTSCHSDMTGFSPAHSPKKISCTACHLGNSKSFNKKESHKNMVVVAGNLSNTSETCAKCHEGIDYRVNHSIMNTMSGIISVDKHVFGENKNVDSLFNIHHLKNKTASDKHLRNKCASCHIGNEKEHPNPITQKSRGGGCTACHLNYSENGKKEHHTYIKSLKKELPKIHPSLSLKITANHCFGCHSRSGRISTNYEGWHETIYTDTLYNNTNYRVLEDKRVFSKQTQDIHHTKGLSCIDCHDSYDVMGDGKKHAHQENATNISCADCHLKFGSNIDTIQTILFKDLNEDEKRIIKLRKLDSTLNYIYANESQKNLINVVKNGNHLTLIKKINSQKISIHQQSEQCTKNVHKNLQCSTCHTSWAPQCIRCHTNYDKKEDGYDLLSKDWTLGTWQEKGNHYLAEFPSLGITVNNGKKIIKTFSPGMIMNLKNADSIKSKFIRLFAPVSAHTITKKGKSCTDCHNHPVALGYGRGKLKYINKKWTFNPQFPLEKDGLPQDAWIGFLRTDTIHKATRNNARPFTLNEQKRILKVGSCLTCHQEKSKVVNLILDDFSTALKNRLAICD